MFPSSTFAQQARPACKNPTPPAAWASVQPANSPPATGTPRLSPPPAPWLALAWAQGRGGTLHNRPAGTAGAGAGLHPGRVQMGAALAARQRGARRQP